MQLGSSNFEISVIGGVYYEDNTVDPTTVFFPGLPEFGLSSDVPNSNVYASFSHLSMVKPNCRYWVFIELRRCQNINKRRFPSILQPNYRQLKLLLPEQRTQPVNKSIPKSHIIIPPDYFPKSPSIS